MSSNFSIFLFDKDENITSFSSLGKFKREHRGEKVGHAGTLDKFASGLMICMIGGATKLNPIFSSFDKSYRAELLFGSETDTLDREGIVVKKSTTIPTYEEIKSVLPSFIGKQKQVPPLYSAIHVNGERAYIEARKNHEVDLPERDIEIYDINLVSYSDNKAIIDCSVSKGTYIRSLARDISYRLNTCGHLVNLRRTQVGPFKLSDVGLSNRELLDKTGLFGTYRVSSKYKKEIDNGFIRRENLIKEDDKPTQFGYLYMDNELYGYIEVLDKVKVLTRV